LRKTSKGTITNSD